MTADDSRSTLKRKGLFLAGFCIYFVALWLLWDTSVIYPLKIFVVMLHEVSHGIAAVATGGTIDRIVLDPRQGGACYCGGGNAFITLSAGYLGSLFWGLVLLAAAGARGNWRRHIVFLLGVAVVALTIGFIRSSFGFYFGLAFGATLLFAARPGWMPPHRVRLGGAASGVVLTVLGLTSCLYAILDIKSDVLDRPELRSDAAMLAELTGIPTVAWGMIWIGIAILASVLAFRRAFKNA